MKKIRLSIVLLVVAAWVLGGAGMALAGKDHIRIGLADVPVGLDFYATTSRVALYYAYMIFDPLVERDAKTGEPKPHLVTSWKVIDPTTWEFKLQPGVTFHNGDPFTAESVRYTIMDRILDPSQKCPQAGGWKWVKDVLVIDDLTFRVITKGPYPLVVERFNVLFPYDPKWTREMEKKHGKGYISRHAMGTGPFKFSEFVEGERLDLERNENYWKKGVPAFKKMTMRFIPEMSTRVAELIAGGIDDAVYIGTDLVPMLEKNDKLTVKEVPILRIFFWQFDNIGRAPKTPAALKDARVRRAIWHAIDCKAIVENVLGGHATYIHTPINPMAFGADPSMPAYKYDPEKAKALMKEAGWEKGFTTSAWVVNDEYAKVTEAAASYLEKINIKLEIKPYIGRYGEFAKLWQAGKADGIATMGWGSYNIFDADAVWSYFFMSPEAPFNYTEDKELSDLLHTARSTLDQAKRKTLYRKCQKIIIDKAYWVPFYARHAIHGTVKNFHYELGADQVPRWQYGSWSD
jgi:peptide/nickel transport system substrate-binding protein